MSAETLRWDATLTVHVTLGGHDCGGDGGRTMVDCATLWSVSVVRIGNGSVADGWRRLGEGERLSEPLSLALDLLVEKIRYALTLHGHQVSQPEGESDETRPG